MSVQQIWGGNVVSARASLGGASVLVFLWLTSTGLAADVKPPKPDAAKPVNYIPWINETLGRGVKENAADVYCQVFEKLTNFEGDWSAVTSGPWSDNKQATVWLAANREALAQFRKAAAMRECFFRAHDTPSTGDARTDHLLMGILLPSLKPYRDAARGLIAEGYRAWRQGDQQTLLANAVAMLRSVHHLDNTMYVIERLVGTACANLSYEALRNMLRLSDKPDALAARILPDLQAADPPRTRSEQAWLGERVSALDFAQRVFVPGAQTGTWTLHKPVLKQLEDMNGEGGLTDAEVRKVAQIGFEPTVRFINSYYDALDKWVATPYHLAAAEADQLDQRAKTCENPLLRKLLSSLPRVRTLEERSVANRRAMHLIACILAQHGKAGAYPASLDALKVSDLKELRTDPFSGRDFVYKKEGTNFTVYTVGENLKDDGGKHDETRKSGDYVYWPMQDKPGTILRK